MHQAGLLNLDKPAGATSHDVVQQIRRLAQTRRVGHAGTLDPLATGVLLVCVGRATRLAEYLVGLPKTYEAVIRLGQSTDTYDADGRLVEERPVSVSPEQVSAALDGFRGPIRQQVPPYSAVKRDGTPLYKLARQGAVKDLPARDVSIYELDLLDFRSPLLRLRVVCSSGTYIRSLVHDLGRALGCGGHVTALRRTAVGDFSLEEAVTLDALMPDSWRAHLRPPESALTHLPRVDFDGEAAARLALGQRLVAPAGFPIGPARAFGPDGRFLGVIEASDGLWRPRKIFRDSNEEGD